MGFVARRKVGSAAGAIICLLFMAAQAAETTAYAADSKCDAPSDECVTVGNWSLSVALGAGVRTNPVV